MLRSTLTAFYRSFTRHPLYALLNLLGLSLGIAVFLTLALFCRFETSFERWLPNASRLHVIETTYTLNNTISPPSPGTSGSLLDDLKTDFQVEGTRVQDNNLTVHLGGQSTKERLERVDAEFFKVFGLRLVVGDTGTALASPDRVVISKTMAAKYFPGVALTAVIGKTLHLTHSDGSFDYRVSGILDDVPDTSDLGFNFVILMTPEHMAAADNWKNYGSQRLATYILATPAEAARIDKAFPDFIDRHASQNFSPDIPHTILRLSTLPLTQLHLQDAKTRTSVYALGVVGILAFLIAAINYINLATARAGMRAREVAVRKTLGATQGALRTQFLCEAALTTLIAALIGLSLVEISLPLINAFGNLKLKLDYVSEGLTLLGAGVFVVATGLLAGLYPAFVLAAFKPAQVLASSRTPAGGRWAIRTREALVVLQFTVVVAFFILITGFFSQLQHMKTADLGFSREGVLITSSTSDAAVSDSQRDAVWSAFKAIPGTMAVTAGNTAPGDETETNGSSIKPAGHAGATLSINWIRTGPDFFATYGGHLTAGRWLDPARGDDRYTVRVDGKVQPQAATEVTNVLINRKALKLLNLASPQAALNQVLEFDGDHKVRIAGVVEDMRFRSPKDPIPATLYLLDPTPYNHAITGVRFAGIPASVMRDRMQVAWRSIAPDVPFETVSAIDNMDAYAKPDRNRSNLFSVGAGVAALIGCIGLYGMAAFNTSRRAREIGLRKVLGASSGQLTRLLVGQFLRPVIIANLLAWPLAYLALKQWLSQFDEAIPINPLYFITASAIAILIALMTVGGLALVSARLEPGKALRHE